MKTDKQFQIMSMVLRRGAETQPTRSPCTATSVSDFLSNGLAIAATAKAMSRVARDIVVADGALR